MKTDQEKIEVMQAFIDGAKIEILLFGEWERCTEPAWNWYEFDYRVKEEPKKTVDLYQWLCYSTNSHYYLTVHHDTAPSEFIRRLDETKITVEV